MTPFPPGAVDALAHGLEDYRLTTPTHQQTPAEAAVAAAEYLVALGYTVTHQEPPMPMTPDHWTTIRGLVTWLDQQNGRDQQEITLRLLKLTEESGEVAQAWIGTTGQNPRKGTTHSVEDVADELCDVIVTAAVALASLIDDPASHLDTKLHRIAERPRTP